MRCGGVGRRVNGHRRCVRRSDRPKPLSGWVLTASVPGRLGYATTPSMGSFGFPRLAQHAGHRHAKDDEDRGAQDHDDRAGDAERGLGRQEVAADVLDSIRHPLRAALLAVAFGDEVGVEVGRRASRVNHGLPSWLVGYRPESKMMLYEASDRLSISPSVHPPAGKHRADDSGPEREDGRYHPAHQSGTGQPLMISRKTPSLEILAQVGDRQAKLSAVLAADLMRDRTLSAPPNTVRTAGASDGHPASGPGR